MLLELAQGFGLVTPDPFASRELGGVWARDYSSLIAGFMNHVSSQSCYVILTLYCACVEWYGICMTFAQCILGILRML